VASRRILITGAGSGLGRGLAVELSRRGHALELCDRSAPGLDETRRLMAADARAHAHPLDVSDAAQIHAMTSRLRDAGRAVDVLINNAGLQHVDRVEEFPVERWDTLVDVMLKGTFLLTRALLPMMRSGAYGRIINIGSIHSLVASPFKSAYVAAKHGLIGFSKVIALETGDVDVTINTICPSYIRTPLVDDQIRKQAERHRIPEQEVIDRIMLEPMPKRRFITNEEVAGTVEFLMSDAARNITGQTIVIDGGWTAR
jgi:3-hydroxybutyrate dehydrogenase